MNCYTRIIKKDCYRIFALVFLLVGGVSASVNTLASIEVKDFAGRQVIVEKPAQRIVALAPHIVENVFTAGAGDRIVGVVDYCDYPEQAKKIPKVGAISAFSIEAIVALQPDLVIVWYSGNATQYIDKLTALNIPVYGSNPKNMKDIAKSIKDYGVLTGNENFANKNAADFTALYTQLRENYAQRPTVTTFYQVWNDPLQTLNGDHLISDVIEMCGGENIFSQEESLAPKVSLEAVIARNPEVILASGMGAEKPEWLDDWRRFASLTAVQRKNLFFVHPDLIQRHTVRILLGAKTICRQLDQARANRK